jgi:16S rRNA (cytidine1402-2'-O)-methyltransferase
LLEPADWVAAVREKEAQGGDRRSAIAAVAKEAGVQRRLVYDAVVTARQP